ncbi:MAG TPA: hypothetical protein VJI73_00030 [Candidatus Paceibacterota bacterium]
MKKILLFLASLVIISLFFVNANKAWGSSLPAPAPYNENDTSTTGILFGQEHSYSVVFRANGEAVVTARLILHNSSDKPINEASFQVSGATSQEMAVYQQILPQRCTKQTYDEKARAYTCQLLTDPDYSTTAYGNYYNYDYGNSSAQAETYYSKAVISQTGELYRITIPKPIDANKSGALIVSYIAKGYVKRSIGDLFTFEFKTLQVPERIKKIRVAVNVDSDLAIRGGQSSVNYNFDFFGVSQGGSISTPIADPSLNRAVSYIGTQGALLKTASELSPNETFSVKGEYAKSGWRLYAGSVIWFIIVVVLIFLIIYFGQKLFARKKSATFITESSGSATSIPLSQAMPMPSAESDKDSSIKLFSLRNNVAGFISVVLVILMTWFLNSSLFNTMTHLLGNQVGGLLLVLGVILIGLIYIFCIFGPATIVASKHGWRAFIAVMISVVFWLIIGMVLATVLFGSGAVSSGTLNYETP